MGLISLTLPNDGETVDAADVNTPFNTIATVINGNIENANIKSDAAIDGTKLADNSIPTTKMKGGAEGWTGLANNPSTITYNGNRNYDLVFNAVDISNTVSPGMKLKLTRTVAAPTQCTDLESGSSQYFSRTSASVQGMTFTDDFVCSAWVKLESYTTGSIVSRFNGTSGWDFQVVGDGRVTLIGYNGGASNISQVTTYASLPLNKWVHVAAQLDMSTFTATTTTSYVMIDGVDVTATVTRGGTNPTALVQAGNLEIGGRNGGLQPFDGKLAQVAVFNAKVTQATIRGYISQGLSGSETSLISAYSFNNSINDLNTTNANNLTANGSAVATNADSPFANAVTAGTEEYALIQKVTYSTNTTVNVQIPEGCAIPTSGGISNVYYSVAKNPYGWVSNADRWTLKSILRVAMSPGFSAVNTWTVSNHKITAPLGDWLAGYYINFALNSSVSGIRSGAISIDSTSYPVTNLKYNDMASFLYNGANTTTTLMAFSKENGRTFSAAETVSITSTIDNATGSETYSIRGDLGDCVLYLKPAGL